MVDLVQRQQAALVAQTIAAANLTASYAEAARIAAAQVQAFLAEPLSVVDTDFTIPALTSAVALNYNGSISATLRLPDVALQFPVPLGIADLSVNLSGDNVIMIIPFGTQQVMRQNQFIMVSTQTTLAGVTLRPSIKFNGWYIAP
jgi:hypothetical protein